MRLKADLEATLQTVGQRPDGRTPAQLTGVFRARFRMALLMVAVRRAAACQQGSPERSPREGRSGRQEGADAQGQQMNASAVRGRGGGHRAFLGRSRGVGVERVPEAGGRAP